jgi:hypothetical protein
VVSRGRNIRSTPQLPLETPEEGPKKIIGKGNTLQGGTSTTELGISDDFHHPHLETLISTSHFPIIPSAGVSRSLKFGSVPTDLFSPGIGLEGESLVTPISPEFVPWFRPRTLEYFLTLGFTTPPPVRFVAFTKRETYVPSSHPAFSSDPLLFPFLPRNTPRVSPV